MTAASLLLVALLAQAPAGDGEIEIGRLRRQLEERPDDVDVRLRLAFVLSWNGHTAEARTHAETVVEAAPKYWDAHLLLARLDAWDKRYDAARERLEEVIAAAPHLRDARTQLAEVELWAGDLDRARTGLEALLEESRSPELLGRLAQVEFELMRHLSAYSIAKDALALDPDEPRALAVKEAVLLVRADVRVELENLPGPKDGHGEILAITALPGNQFGFTITEEFRQRFGTTNNRLSFAGHWLPAKGWAVTALFAFGLPAEVIAELTASIRANVPIFGPLDAGLSYTFDRFPDNLLLHRARADVGLRITDTLQAVIGYVLGLLDDGPTNETLHFAQAQVLWESLPYAVSASYGFGRQIDRLVLDPGAPLFSYLSHEIHLSGAYELKRWIRLGLDLGTVLRSNRTRVDRFGILARFSF